MGKSANIEVDYNRIEQMTGETKSIISGELNSVVSNYSKIGSNMSKSAGETLEAIKAQAAAEQQLASAMSAACSQLVASIVNAAESFRGLDTTMTGAMNTRDRR